MKKYSVILVLVLFLVVAAVASPAVAQDERPVRLAGEITAIDTGLDQLTVKPRFRDAFTVQITADTEFWRKVGRDGLEPITFDDLVVGDHVQVGGTWNGELLEANIVILLPETAPDPLAVHGLISELNAENGTLTILTREGDPIVVQTFETTQFYRLLRHSRLLPIAFEDLVVRDWVKVQGAYENGVFNARVVTVMPLKPGTYLPKITGRIESINEAGTFSIIPRQSDPIKVITDGETKFYRALRWGQLQPILFEDLAVDQKVMVQGERGTDGFEADLVIVMRGRGNDLEEELIELQP